MFIGCSSQKNKAPPVVHLHVLKGSHKAKDFSVDCPDGGFLTISPLLRKHKSPQAQPRNAKKIYKYPKRDLYNDSDRGLWPTVSLVSGELKNGCTAYPTPTVHVWKATNHTYLI